MVKPIQTFILWRQFVVWLRTLLLQLSTGKVNWKDTLNRLLAIVTKGGKLIDDDDKPTDPVVPPPIDPVDPVDPDNQNKRRRPLLNLLRKWREKWSRK